MVKNVKVTIGFCVKNAEATVKEAVESILCQNFPLELMELIIVDGCSKDKTLMIIRKNLLKTDIKRQIFQENKGLGHARQIAVDNASGDYIVWVDGDMLLERDFIRNHVEYMEHSPSVGIAVGQHELYGGANLVATLENIEDLIDFKCEGKVHSTPLGTGGSIYRVEAVRQVGGFDQNFKGAGEDMDVENRIRLAGWLLCTSPKARFFERRRITWKALWDEYFWYGYGGHYAFYKNRDLINLYKMLPPLAILTEFLRSSTAYKLTRQKVFFFLPFHYVYKRIAWIFGFIKGHMDGYRPYSNISNPKSQLPPKSRGSD